MNTNTVELTTPTHRHVSLITKPALKELMRNHDEPCVSILLPTVVKGDTRQNPIRFKNLYRSAVAEVESGYDMKKDEIDSLFGPAHTLLEDTLFWEFQSDGLAVYLSPDFSAMYHLPVAPPEIAVANERFYLKPLLPVFAHGGRFFILAVSQNKTRLLEATPSTITEIPVSFPSVEDLHQRDTHLQHHTIQGPDAGGVTQFHGQGAGKDDKKSEIRKVFSQVDQLVSSLLEGETAPLVLAGTTSNLSIYRDVSSYPYVVDEQIDRHLEADRLEDLHREVTTLLLPRFSESEQKAVEAAKASAAGEKTEPRLQEILTAAHQGRVASLLIREKKPVWGMFEPSTEGLLIHDERQPGDEDLLDLAAFATLENGGQVFVVPESNLPAASPAAANFRY